MKQILRIIVLLSALGATAHAKTEKVHRDPSSVKPGHFVCAETDTDKGMDAVQAFLRNGRLPEDMRSQCEYQR